MKEYKLVLNKKIGKLTKSTAFAVFLVTLLLTAVVHISTGNFYTSYNILTFTRQAAFYMIIAFGQTLCLLNDGIDLSIASNGALTSMIVSYMLTKYNVNPVAAIVLGLAIGFVLGSLNGIVITKLHLNAFIVTMAADNIFRGVIYVVTEGMPITGIPESVTWIGQNDLFGVVPYPLIVAIVMCIVLAIVLKYTSFGRHIYAIGGNAAAARIVGVNVEKTRVLVYALSGMIGAIASIIQVFRLGAFQVKLGETWAMTSITAAVLGGTAMSGGVGGVVGTIFGALMISTISFTIGLMGISSYWEKIVVGGIVLIAVAIDAISSIKRSK